MTSDEVKPPMTDDDFNAIVSTAVSIQMGEVFDFAKNSREARSDYRRTNEWYGGDTIARRTAVVCFDPPVDLTEFRKSLFKSFALFYRRYCSPAYKVSAKTILVSGGRVGVMLHASFDEERAKGLSKEDLDVIEDSRMAHWYERNVDDIR